jgi:hypothetical protein
MTLTRAGPVLRASCSIHSYSERKLLQPDWSVSMGTEYVLTEDDRPAEDASLVEDIVELRLLTAGDTTGPVDHVHAEEHHNF